MGCTSPKAEQLGLLGAAMKLDHTERKLCLVDTAIIAVFVLCSVLYGGCAGYQCHTDAECYVECVQRGGNGCEQAPSEVVSAALRCDGRGSMKRR